MGILNKLLTAALLFCFMGCTEFERDYDKIDGEFLRVLTTQFVEPDLAPGDTARFRIYTSGKKISSADISPDKWDVSWEYYMPESAEFVSAVEGKPEPLISYFVGGVTEIPLGDNSVQCFEFSFEIPDSIVYNSPAIPDEWTDMLKWGISLDEDVSDIPTSKVGLLKYIENLISDPDSQAEYSAAEGASLNSVLQQIAIRFHLYINLEGVGGFKQKIYHSVRYNSKLDAIPGVYSNRNPIIQSVKVYDLSADVSNFDPVNDKALIKAEYEMVNDTIKMPLNPTDVSSRYIVFEALRDSSMTVIQGVTSKVAGFESLNSYYFSDRDGLNGITIDKANDGDNLMLNDHENGAQRAVFEMTFIDLTTDRDYFVDFELSDFNFGAGEHPTGRDFRQIIFDFQ